MEAAEKGEIFHVEVWAPRGLNDGFDLELSSFAVLREVMSVTSLRFGVLTSCQPV